MDSVQALISKHQKPDWPAELTIVSVPASEKRIRERGIDQAALIADILKEAWFPNAKRADLLKRIKHTLPNAKLEDERARQGNVNGAFECSVERVAGSVILVDDVYTSGATMNECMRVLKEAGASEVKLFTIARG
jgi:ComF family protein